MNEFNVLSCNRFIQLLPDGGARTFVGTVHKGELLKIHVMPAKAGIRKGELLAAQWIPAFAGMTIMLEICIFRGSQRGIAMPDTGANLSRKDLVIAL